VTDEAEANHDRDRVLGRLRTWLDGYSNHAETTVGAGAVLGSLAAAEVESPEAAELAPEWESSMVYNAFGWATLRIVAAVDHLRSLSRLLAPPPAIFATYSVGRAVLELTARVYWLLDPELGVRARAARHISEDLLYSFWEVQRAGVGLSDGATTESRIELCLDWAETHGFEFDRGDGRRRAPWIGERRPFATRLVNEMAPGHGDGPGLGQAYQIWAGKSHGTAAGYAPSLVPAANPSTGERVTQARVTDQDLVQIVGVSILSFKAMFDRAVDVFGWDRGVWESWDTHAMRDLIALWKRIGDPPSSATTAEVTQTGG
jgi:hypothetical protein